MFGVLNIDKPLNLTSHDVVARVRKKLGIKKVGHAGTLDPLATGVLPVCVGDATRLIEYFPGDKRYQAWITFGTATTTWDAEGEVVASVPAEGLARENIEVLLQAFQGKIQQQVPPHSAVHVNGKKLYEYARKGIAVKLPVREAEIFEITLLKFDNLTAMVDIHCASGTYVRSIAQELGQLTGYGAYLSKLVRTSHGKFSLESSVSLEEVTENDLLNPAEFIPFPQVNLSREALEKIQHGMKLQPEDMELSSEVRNNRHYLLCYDHLPVGVAVGEFTRRLKPVKVFPLKLELPQQTVS